MLLIRVNVAIDEFPSGMMVDNGRLNFVESAQVPFTVMYIYIFFISWAIFTKQTIISDGMKLTLRPRSRRDYSRVHDMQSW